MATLTHMRGRTPTQPLSATTLLHHSARRDHGDLRPGDDGGEEVDGVGAEIRERAGAADEVAALECPLPGGSDEATAFLRDLRERPRAGIADHRRDDAVG